MGPLRTGVFYGVVAVLVAVLANLYFLFLDPAETAEWVLAVVHEYRQQLAFAAYLFLGILAALRTRPVRLDPGVPYRSLLLRDGALAATVVAVMVGATLFLLTFLQATVFADEAMAYARQAAPKIVAYVDEARRELSDPPPPPNVGAVREALQPPQLRDVGRSMANAVLRAILMGTLGALVGALRGRSGSEAGGEAPETGKPPER